MILIFEYQLLTVRPLSHFYSIQPSDLFLKNNIQQMILIF